MIPRRGDTAGIARAMLAGALVAIAIVLLVAGCAQETRRFYKEGATLADYNRDAYECERDTLGVASAYTFGRGFVAEYNARNFAYRCMIARGWDFR